MKWSIQSQDFFFLFFFFKMLNVSKPGHLFRYYQLEKHVLPKDQRGEETAVHSLHEHRESNGNFKKGIKHCRCAFKKKK